MRQLIDSRIRLAVVLIIMVFVTGIVGFRFLYDYTWIDALYMTIITVSTVGYGEVQPMGGLRKVIYFLFYYFRTVHLWFRSLYDHRTYSE
ncbi:ion channel [Christiangramia sp. OXR-203]|uniref:ion channel n=1 Tax=Christiangramia sp. OXR-203 TaxID=3100176 RepID=UPI002AC9E7A2|nr:ion channel [Christiangramia sp. OXR-203]WPY99390.1 ion channel [Christiangramia sp. OXR-203]